MSAAQDVAFILALILGLGGGSLFVTGSRAKSAPLIIIAVVIVVAGVTAGFWFPALVGGGS